MVAPIDANWAKIDISANNLNKTTYGQGTSFPSTWPVDRVFWRTDRNLLYKNKGSEGTPSWVVASASIPSGIVFPTIRDPNLFLQTDTHILYQLKSLSIAENSYSSWGVHNQTVNNFKLNRGTINPIINENFIDYENQAEADLAWIPTVATQVGVNITNDNIVFIIPNSIDTKTCYIDLETALNDSAWVMRMKIILSATAFAGVVNHSMYFGISSNISGVTTIQDLLGFLIYYDGAGDTRTWRAAFADGVAPHDSATKSASIRTCAVETVYAEMKRLSATSSSFELFSDAAFTTSLGSTTQTPPSTIQTLRYLKFGFRDDGNEATKTLTGTIDDIAIKDGVTTW